MTNRYAVASSQADWSVLRRFPPNLRAAGVTADWIQTSGWHSQNFIALRKGDRKRNATAGSDPRNSQASPSAALTIAVNAARSNGLGIAVVPGADRATQESLTSVTSPAWTRPDWDPFQGLAAGFPDPGIRRRRATSGVEAERAAPKGEGR